MGKELFTLTHLFENDNKATKAEVFTTISNLLLMEACSIIKINVYKLNIFPQSLLNVKTEKIKLCIFEM